MSRRPFAALLLSLASLVANAACAAPSPEDAAGSDEAMRALQAGDVDEVVVEDVPVGNPASPDLDVFSRVRFWTVRHVELRDPKDSRKPDPEEPFSGFFLVGSDENHVPLFFEATALVDGAAVRSFFSVATTTNDSGEESYVELPIASAQGDEESVRRSQAARAWFDQERSETVVSALRRQYPSDTGTASLRPRGLSKTGIDSVKCAAEIALLAFTATNPITMFLVSAGVDGAIALIEAANDGSGSADAADAAVNATLAASVKGAEKALSRSVSTALVAAAAGSAVKRQLPKLFAGAVVGIVGYQVWDKGVSGGLKRTTELLVPSCVALYDDMTADNRPR